MDYRGIPVDEFLSGQMLQDLYHFEGNAQALRQVGKLHFLSNEYGMNLTCGLLGAIIKYPVSSLEMDGESLDVKKRKLGYFYGERQLYRQICQATGTDGNRNPLAFILEAADDIAYKTADIEDAFIKGLSLIIHY